METSKEIGIRAYLSAHFGKFFITLFAIIFSGIIVVLMSSYKNPQQAKDTVAKVSYAGKYFEDMKLNELRQYLKDEKVKYPEKATRLDLIDLAYKHVGDKFVLTGDTDSHANWR